MTQCHAMTTKGSRCKRYAAPGCGGCCKQHAVQANTYTAEPVTRNAPAANLTPDTQDAPEVIAHIKSEGGSYAHSAFDAARHANQQFVREYRRAAGPRKFANAGTPREHFANDPAWQWQDVPAPTPAPEQGEVVQTARCSPVLTATQRAAAVAMLTPDQVASVAKPARVKRCSVCHCEVNVFGCKPIRRSRPSGGYDGCRRASRSPAPLPVGWDAAVLSGVQGSGPDGLPADVPGWSAVPTRSDAAPQWASASGAYHAPGKVRPVAVPASYVPTTVCPPCPAFTIADAHPMHVETVDVPFDLSRMADDGCPWSDAT